LAAATRPDGIIPLHVHSFPSGWDARTVISAARDRDCTTLTTLGRRLRAEAEADRGSPWRGVTARLVQVSTGPALLQSRGLTVALLAPDGAGKSAVATALRASLPVAVKVIYMGRARTTRGGRRGSVAAALLRQWRRHLTARFHGFQGKLVLFDRYTYDAMLPPRQRKPARIARRWLFAHAIPAPDLVVLLDAPADLMFQRKGEHPRNFLESRRRDYLDLKSRLPNMVVVDAAQDLDAVRRDVTRAIWSMYRSRLMSKRFNRPWSPHRSAGPKRRR
jgi:thymidylate kinase